MTDPDPGRLAAIDQELASLNAKLNRGRRIVMWINVLTLAIALTTIGEQVTGGPPLSRTTVVLWLAVVAMQAAGDLFHRRRVCGRKT